MNPWVFSLPIINMRIWSKFFSCFKSKTKPLLNLELVENLMIENNDLELVLNIQDWNRIVENR